MVRTRHVYLVRWSGQEGPQRWRWSCPEGCGFRVDEDGMSTAGKKKAQDLADAHRCRAGWSPIPMTPERVAAGLLAHIPEPTKEDRMAWWRLAESKKEATRRR